MGDVPPHPFTYAKLPLNGWRNGTKFKSWQYKVMKTFCGIWSNTNYNTQNCENLHNIIYVNFQNTSSSMGPIHIQ